MYKFLCSVLLVLTLTHCDTSNPKPQPVAIDPVFGQSTRNFSFDFIKTFDQDYVGQNYFVSPMSLHMALGMLLNGTEGLSKEELLNVLHLQNISEEVYNENFKKLIDELPKADPKVVNTLANSLWQREGFAVNSVYTDLLKASFKAELHEEDFTKPATLNKINQWAADNTNDKIKEILTEISPDQVLFLINALYFKGDWKAKFDKSKTAQKPFYGQNATKQVDMMMQQDTFAMADLNGIKVLEMPYGDGQYTMRIVLPENGNVEQVLSGMNQIMWEEMTNKMAVKKVNVSFPKLEMTFNAKLNDVLKTMGVPSIFSSDANLSGIAGTPGDLVVGFVKQDAFLKVDEEGSEAAAVTVIGIELTSVPLVEEFNCDKPFVFFIYEKTSGTIQFIGKINNL